MACPSTSTTLQKSNSLSLEMINGSFKMNKWIWKTYLTDLKSQLFSTSVMWSLLFLFDKSILFKQNASL